MRSEVLGLRKWEWVQEFRVGELPNKSGITIQGYLAHKKTPPTRTLR